MAGVLELDRAGPEPAAVADLGEVTPLRLDHHNWQGTLSHCNFEWVLPRSYKVIGSLPPLHAEPSLTYSYGWRLGDHLARQRWWDAGNRDPLRLPGRLARDEASLAETLASSEPRTGVRDLSVTGITTLDCARLTRVFPRLTGLSLGGDLGTLTNAGHLNALAGLRRFQVANLFGMEAADALRLDAVPELEFVTLQSVPAAYAAATRSVWRPEAVNGTYLDIGAPRKPEWVAENRDNPLRDWDGRDHISVGTFKKAVKQYKLTRRAVLDVLSARELSHERLERLGREYAEAFNALDANGLIETEEREELFAALDRIIDDAEATHGHPLPQAREALTSGAESTRDW